jgi:uncharacterized protein
MKKTLYVNRPLLNGHHIVEWAKSQGFKTTIDPSDMHATIAFSKQPVDWNKIEPLKGDFILRGAMGTVKQFDNSATVMTFKSGRLSQRWNEFIKAGASWDWPEYQPHITISYKADNIDPSKVRPFEGTLWFGPEKFKEVDLDWKSNVEEIPVDEK